MTAPCWTLKEYNARLSAEGLDARLNLLDPAAGLAEVKFSGVTLAGARLLGVEIPSHRQGDAEGIVRRHVRGSELVAAYGETEAWPVHVDLTWRAIVVPECLAAIDLLVSVGTEQLESRPSLVVQSVLPTSENPLGVGRSGNTGCLVFRLPGGDASYVEMVHPADGGRDELRCEESVGHLSHQLFLAPLEKGVLLRSRVRGLFISRDGDLEVAAKCYKEFITAAPPLAD